MRPKHKAPVVTEAKDIPVYPEFCSMKGGNHGGISDGPWLCENDYGQIAFVSHEMKMRYLSRKAHSMNGMRRTKR